MGAPGYKALSVICVHSRSHSTVDLKKGGGQFSAHEIFWLCYPLRIFLFLLPKQRELHVKKESTKHDVLKKKNFTWKPRTQQEKRQDPKNEIGPVMFW